MRRAIPPAVLARCAASLRVLAHPTRLRIVELLEAKRHTVGELADLVGEPQPVVSQHLIRMRAVDLLRVERDGRRAYYRIANPSCPAVLSCIREHFV